MEDTWKWSQVLFQVFPLTFLGIQCLILWFHEIRCDILEVGRLFRLLVRILHLFKLYFQQFTFADVSTFRVTSYRNKKYFFFFFHVSLTLKSTLEWAEQVTALCLCEEISVSQMVMEVNVSWPFWIAVILGWLVLSSYSDCLWKQLYKVAWYMVSVLAVILWFSITCEGWVCCIYEDCRVWANEQS